MTALVPLMRLSFDLLSEKIDERIMPRDDSFDLAFFGRGSIICVRSACQSEGVPLHGLVWRGSGLAKGKTCLLCGE